jgi:iron complex outermembrane receptor protein
MQGSHLAPAALLALLPAVVFAQTESESAALPMPVARGEEVVVTATRFEQPAQDIPVGMIVITDEDIRASGVSTLPELFARQPGITVRDNSGSPDQSVDLRGFGITGDQNTLVLIDGQRLSENELTSARWSTIPLAAIDRIEILRGSGTVLYGGGATGGVINIITKSPQQGDRDFNVYGGYGSYDTLDLRAGGSIAGDKAGFTINGGRYSSDNYRAHNRVEQRNVEAALQTLGSGPSLALKIGADDQDLQLPGARTAAQIQTDPRGATTPNDFSNRNGWHALGTSRFDLGFGELAADLGYRDKDSQLSSMFLGSHFNTQTNVQTWSFNPRLKVPHQLLGAPSTLIAGVDADWWDYEQKRDFGSVDLTAFQRNDAFYLQHSTQLPTATTVSLGARVEESRMTARDASTGQPYGKGSQTVRPHAYELGLRQSLTDTLSAYGKIGRSFRIANIDEVYNQFGGPVFDPIVTFLQPQTSNDRELGLEWKRQSTFLRASVYSMDIENEIHFDGNTGANVNLPPTRRYGAELEANWRVVRWLELGANYTFAVSQFRSGQLNGADVSGKTVPLVPRHKFNLTGNLDFNADTRLNAVFTYVGSQFFDGDETNTFGQKIPAYRLLDLKLSHRIGQWTLAVAGTNLLDEKYYNYGLVVPNTFVAYPQAGRGVFASVEYRTR